MNNDPAFWWKVGGGVAFTGCVMAYNYFRAMPAKQFKALMGNLPYIAAGAVALVALLILVLWWLKRRREAAAAAQQAKINQAVANGKTYLVLPRRDWDTVNAATVQLWARLAEALPAGEHCAFEVGGNNDVVMFTIHATEPTIAMILNQLQTEWAKVSRREVDGKKTTDPLAPPDGWSTHYFEIGPQAADKAIVPAADDPLFAAFSFLAELPDTARGGIQIVARSNAAHRQRLSQQSVGMRAQSAATPTQAGTRTAANKAAKAIEDRAAHAFLDAIIRVYVHASDQKAAQTYAQSLARIVCAQFGKSNTVSVIGQGQQARALTGRVFAGQARPWSDTELGLLAHLTGKDAFSRVPMLQTASAVNLPPSPASRVPASARIARIVGQEDRRINDDPQAEPWIVTGHYTDAAGKMMDIGFPLADMQTHASVVGTTGSGKSTYLRSLAAQCFGLGATVYIQEPHGDLCTDVITAVPDTMLDRVVYFDLNSRFPPSIPLLTIGLNRGVSTAVAVAMRAMRVAEPASWDASQKMRDLLRHALTVILSVEGPQASLISLGRLLKEAESMYREELLSVCPDDVDESRDFIQGKVCPALDGEKGTKDMATAVDGARRRLSIFLNDERFRRSLACPPIGPVVNMREMLTGGRMVLSPVKVAELGDAPARVVGTLLMDMVNGAFFARTAKADRAPTIIILDEFASMAGSEIGDQVKVMLAQLRKFGACAVLATQSASQLPVDVQKEFDGNTNLKVCLLVGSDADARLALNALGTRDATPLDLMAVEKFHGYVRIVVNKAKMAACYLKMPAPMTLADPLDGGARIEVGSAPAMSAEFKAVRELAKLAADPADLEAARPLMKRLTEMDTPTWEGLVAEITALNQYSARALLANPKFEPDRVKRAIRISSGLYGFPWYMLEAWSRRLRKSSKASAPARSAAGGDFLSQMSDPGQAGESEEVVHELD